MSQWECLYDFCVCTQSLAGGKVVVALEGGYNLRSIARSMEACARALLGEDPQGIINTTRTRLQDIQAVDETIQFHLPFWKSLRTYSSPNPDLCGGGDNEPDVGIDIFDFEVFDESNMDFSRESAITEILSDVDDHNFQIEEVEL